MSDSSDGGGSRDEIASTAIDEARGTAWIDVLGEDDLWVGEMMGIEVQGEPVLLVGADDGVRAFEDKCPHNGGLLSKGEFCDGVIVCTRHQWEFCASSGQGVNPSDSALKGIPIRVVEGRIQVSLPASRAT